MIKESIISLALNLFILELIPFIYIKSFGCSDYLASGDRENMMILAKWLFRLLALIVSMVVGFFIFGGRGNVLMIYHIIGYIWFIILWIFFSPVDKFMFFKTDGLKKRCENYKPRFKLSDK